MPTVNIVLARTVRALLKHQGVTQPLFEFMDEHPLIRPMSDYGEFRA